jgi:hypothetical protein
MAALVNPPVLGGPMVALGELTNARVDGSSGRRSRV